MAIVLSLVAAGIAWATWGFSAAVAVALAGVVIYKLVWFNTKRLAARNAVYAALTYRGLDAGQRGAVDGTVVNICQRLRIDTASLGEPFPGSDAIDHPTLSSPAAVFAFRSLAMHELGIPAVGTKDPRWYVLRNPFVATLAKGQILKFRKRVEAEYGVRLTELDA